MLTDNVITALPQARCWPQMDGQYSLSVVTPPPVEPVSYADLAAYLRLNDDTDAAIVTALGEAGRQYVEERARRTFITTTYAVSFDSFNDMIGLRLPRRPVTSVASVTYIDQGANVQTLPTSQYIVDTKLFTRIRPAPYVILPVTLPGQTNAVTVTFTAGESSTAAGVDPMGIHAIKAWVNTQYNNMATTGDGDKPNATAKAFDSIMALLGAPEVG